MIGRLAVLAEAGPRVGTGHVAEAFAVGRAAMARGVAVRLWLNTATPTALLRHAPCPPALVESFDPVVCRSIAAVLADAGYPAVLVSFRRVDNAQVLALRAKGTRIVCMDELGDQRLDCHAVVNNAIAGKRHRYVSGHPDFRLYAGPEYLALAEPFSRLNALPRVHRGLITRLAVSCGGVDRIGTTVRVARALASWRPEVERHFVLGAGYAHREELAAVVAAHAEDRVVVHENLPGLAELFASCDVAFTAGGNTLYELACVGTPAIVLSEDPHEGEAGRTFEALGFGCCLGQATTVEPAAIRNVLAALENPDVRQQQNSAGRRLVDGLGAGRILEVLDAVAADGPAVRR